jgi:tight adherence protein C
MDATRVVIWLRDPLLWAGAAVVVCAAVAVGIAVRELIGRAADPVQERLARATGAIALGGGAAEATAIRRGGESEGRAPSAGSRVLRALSRLARPGTDEEMSRTRTRLEHAGVRGPHASELFFGAKLALSLALAGGFVLAAALIAPSLQRTGMVAVVLAAIGFYAPNVWLSGRVTERQKQLSRALPDTLDLLVTCVEAGLSIEAAMARVVDEIGLGAPLLAAELSQVMGEMRAGMSRAEAMRRLAERTGLDELRALSAMLVQTELFGTSVSRALRIHASGMRTQRTQRAEERAATVATKMLVPLIFCILPSLFSVILGPAVVRIVHQLLPSLGAQS